MAGKEHAELAGEGPAPTRRWRKVAEALAYDVRGYERPNPEAVENAMESIDKVRRAATAAGLRIVLYENDPNPGKPTIRKGRC